MFLTTEASLFNTMLMLAYASMNPSSFYLSGLSASHPSHVTVDPKGSEEQFLEFRGASDANVHHVRQLLTPRS